MARPEIALRMPAGENYRLSIRRPTALPQLSHFPCKTKSPPLTLPVVLSMLVVSRHCPHQTEFNISNRCSEGIADQSFWAWSVKLVKEFSSVGFGTKYQLAWRRLL